MSIQHYIDQIKTDGYCILPQVFGQAEIDQALALIQEWVKRTEGLIPTEIPRLAKGILWNLQNKDAFFSKLLFQSPELHQILLHFLNDRWYRQIPQDEPNYILRTFLARSSREEQLPMHIDSFVPYEGSHVFVMQASFVLEDQTEENGATMVVPGSHLSGHYTNQEAFKDAIPVESRAGDVVVWDSRIWHGAGINRSNRTRWSLISTFVRWWIKQAFHFTNNMPAEIYEQLTPSQKAVLGFCTIPYDSEFDGIDIKKGYEALPSLEATPHG